jgi:hypothetical protein
MDLISECLDMFKDALFIVDEFHNLSSTNISDENNDIFKLLMSDHKILFMSATPRIYDIEYDDETYDMDWLFGEIVHQITFTDAIANKYITDYKIWLPSIHENNEDLDTELSIYEIDNHLKNRCKFLHSCIANNGSRKCIIYCKDTQDMNNMMDCVTKLNGFYVMDIEINGICCEDSETKRKHKLESFANNNDKIQLLFNIKILNECIDIPVCDSIYISYAPKNKITTIQRMCRAMRTNENDPYKIANIYMWCNDYEQILHTLSSIKEYDIMFRNKIKINVVDFYHTKEKKDIELVENDKILLDSYTLSVKEFKQITWEDKLQIIENYITENGSLPSVLNKINKYKQLGAWVHDQKHQYKTNTKIMKKAHIRMLWEAFMKKHHTLFRTNAEKWQDKLNEVQIYIQQHNTLPEKTDSNENVMKLGIWIARQKQAYKNIDMSDVHQRTLWEGFVKQNSTLFRTYAEAWMANLHKLKQYVNTHSELPQITDTSQDVKTLHLWVVTQKSNYAKKEFKNETFFNLWHQFVTENHKLFMSKKEVWKTKFNSVQEYVQKHKILPSRQSLDPEVKKMAEWIQSQKTKYISGSIADDDIRQLWESFISKNEQCKTNLQKWYENFENVKEYVRLHNKLPSKEKGNDDNVKRLGSWVHTQKQNYQKKTQTMKDENIFKIWDEFVKEHPLLYRTNSEIWNAKLDDVKVYIENNNKLPSSNDKDVQIMTMGIWIGTQKQNYDKKEDIMKLDDIRQLWEGFVYNYNHFFKSHIEIWHEKLAILKDFIISNNKLPSNSENNNEEINSLASWTKRQKKIYSEKKEIMAVEDIRKEWELLNEAYPSLFMNREECWKLKLNKLMAFMDTYKKLPSIRDTDENEKLLANFLYVQRQTYKSKTKIMKSENIRQLWEEFAINYDSNSIPQTSVS